ncbi:MAG: PBP1A family penicillin-binding protein [Lachnospiraceae bacterium]|nr:PBP1A family penicillin-binding protein [Lachnospiraceae bacterium]
MNFTQRGTMQKQEEINSSPKRVSNKIILTIIRIIVIAIVSCIVIGIFLISGFIKGLVDTSPDVSKLSVVPSKFATKIYDEDGKLIQEFKGAESNREYVQISRIPDTVQKAFISIEDERFYEHNGIDIKGIFRASLSGFSQGASTITQQLIKNQIFNAGMEETFSAKLERKVQEQYLAIKLENKLTKDQILEYYLNTINLGAGTYGVQTASKEYFGKSVSDLSVSEAAVIASITQQPTALNPIEHPDNNKRRQQIVIKKMYENKYISDKEYDEAMKDDVYARISAVNLKREKTEKKEDTVNSYFVDALYYQVLNDLINVANYDSDTAKTLLNSGGLKIYSTLDSSIQKTCDNITSDEDNYPEKYYQLDYQLSVTTSENKTKNYSVGHLEQYWKKKDSSFSLLFKDKSNADKYIKEFKEHILSEGNTFIADKTSFTLEPQVSFVIMDQSNGAIKAMVGGRGDKDGSLSFNRATDAERQPGSTFKIVSSFLPALDTNEMTLASVQNDSYFCYKEGKKSKVNSWRGSHKGLVTMREAIWDSNNVATVRTIYDVGIPVSLKYLHNLGFTTLVDKSDCSGAIALGGLTKGVTNLELTAAYASIANNGTYNKPFYYTKVVDSTGKVILKHKTTTKKVMKETTAWLLTNAMQDVVKSYGTGAPANFSNMNIAGKTGTTSGKYDLWFAGYTPYYTASVWTGYDNNNRSAGGSSSSYHKKIWRKIMEAIHKELENKSFTRPNGITSATICTKCGYRAIEGLCSHAQGAESGNFVKSEYFASGTVPSKYCTCHQKIKVCSVTGKLASDKCNAVERVYLIKDNASGTADSKYILTSANNTTCTECDGSSIIDNIFDSIINNSSSDDGSSQETVNEDAVPQANIPTVEHEEQEAPAEDTIE